MPRDDNGHLQCPINAKGTKSGYQYIALLEFKRLGMNVNLHRLDEGCGIAETLSSHSAVYHKSCYLRFTSSKLERAQKKRAYIYLQENQKHARYFKSMSAGARMFFL